MINSCEPYWKLQCIRTGLFHDLDLLQREMIKFGSFKELFSALLKFKRHIKPELLTLEQTKLCNKLCSPLLNDFYYSCPTTINANISVFKRPSISSKQTQTCTVENVFLHGYPSILWSSSSSNRVLLCTNNGRWLKFHFPADDSCPSSAHTWEDDSVRSFIYHVAGSCPNCSFIVIMGKRRDADSLWKLETLQLKMGHQNVVTVAVKLHFFPRELDVSDTEDEQEGLDPLRVHSLSLIPLCQSSPDSCLHNQEHEGNCDYTKHRLLVQFGYGVVVFELSTSISQCIISTPLKIWCPNQPTQDFLYTSSTQCMLSNDCVLVALCKSNVMREINVWNMENGKECTVFIPNYSDKTKLKKLTKFLAVGHLFTVVAKYLGGCLPNIYIMSTVSGGVFCECDLNTVKSPLMSKITSTYFQMIVVRELTEQHLKLLMALELGSSRLWLDTLAHNCGYSLCFVPCVSAHGTTIIIFNF